MSAHIDTHDVTVVVAYEFDPRYPNLAPTVPLPGVIRLEVSEDVDRTPFLLGSVTAPRPSDDVMAKLDPRTFPAIRVQMTSTAVVSHHVPARTSDVTSLFGGGFVSAVSTAVWGSTQALSALFPGTEVVTELTPGVAPTTRTVFLQVTAVEENIEENTVTIIAAGAEVLLDYWANMSPLPVDMSGYGTVDGIVMEACARVKVPTPGIWYGAIPTLPTADAMLWQPGQTAHDFIDGLLELNGKRIYGHGTAQLEVADTGTIGDSFAGTIALDYRNGMSSAGRSLANGASKNEYFDSVLILYRWKNSAGVDQLAYDRYPASGTYRKSLVLKRDRAYPGAGAAQSIYTRSRKRGGDYTVRQVSRYDVSCGWASTLLLPGDSMPKQTAIKAISWAFPAAEMTLRLELKEA